MPDVLGLGPQALQAFIREHQFVSLLRQSGIDEELFDVIAGLDASVLRAALRG